MSLSCSHLVRNSNSELFSDGTMFISILICLKIPYQVFTAAIIGRSLKGEAFFKVTKDTEHPFSSEYGSC